MAAVVSTLGGCSADISRFDNASFGLTDSKPAATASRRNNTQGLTSVEPASPGGAYFPPSSGQSSGNVRTAALPEPAPSTFGGGGSSVPFDRPKKGAGAAAATVQPKAIAAGQTIDVAPGDTLYGISRKYGVPVNEVMTLNSMTSPNLKPGQKLVLPASKSIARAVPKRTETAAATDVPAAAAPKAKAAAPVAAAAAVATPVAAATTVARTPKLINGATTQQVAAIAPSAPTATDATTADTAVDAKADTKKGTEVAAAGGAAIGATKFRWPAKGKIIANFGARPDGTHNDGVNVAVPQGTEVHAAEAGTVAYAGSELKGYGNLVLLRHENGWVTAYAHNEEILVKRGDKVKRGQAVAKAGKTGTVDQPQVHFELRQGQKPVDPMPHMEKM